MKKLITTLIFALMAVPAMAQETAMQEGGERWLKPVEAEYVCMVNDEKFDKVQIPVEVDGTTYYGCCAACEARLKNDPAIRSATDPVSGQSVDKAEAVIGAGPDNKAYYFENEENFQAYADGPMPEADDHGAMEGGMKGGMMDEGMDEGMRETMEEMHRQMETMHDNHEEMGDHGHDEHGHESEGHNNHGHEEE